MGDVTTGLQDGRMIVDWLSFTFPADNGLGMAAYFGEMVPHPVGII